LIVDTYNMIKNIIYTSKTKMAIEATDISGMDRRKNKIGRASCRQEC